MNTKVKKPNFFLILLRVFLILLVISMACGWGFLFVMKSRKNNAREEKKEAILTEVVAFTKEIYAEENPATRQYMCMQLRRLLGTVLRTDDLFLEVYVDGAQAATTIDLIPVEIFYNGEYYMMADYSPMDSLDDFADGTFAISEESERYSKYKYDPIGIRMYDIDPDKADEYAYLIETVCIDPYTKRFYPSQIDILPNTDEGFSVMITDDGIVIDSGWTRYAFQSEKMIEYTPIDQPVSNMNNGVFWFSSSSYVPECTRSFSEADTVCYAKKNEDGTISEMKETYELTGDYNSLWSVKYTSKLKSFSIFKMFPLLVPAVMGVAVLGSLLLGIVIALIIFYKRKAKSDVSEYRKRTTEDMAHDLKTPLAAISGYAEMLEENWNAKSSGKRSDSKEDQSEALNEENAEYVKKIRENVNEMNKMVEGILTFSKSEGQDGAGKLQQVDITELIEKSVKKHNYLFEKNKITVKTSGSIPPKTTDPQLLSQVIDNLLSNCARYAKPESEVRIELSKDEITIRNEIDGKIDNVDELIKPFKKGNDARGENGTGLGLAIVDNDLKMLGYGFRLHSEEGEFSSTITIK